jgi:hypothetical protein
VGRQNRGVRPDASDQQFGVEELECGHIVFIHKEEAPLGFGKLDLQSNVGN